MVLLPCSAFSQSSEGAGTVPAAEASAPGAPAASASDVPAPGAGTPGPAVSVPDAAPAEGADTPASAQAAAVPVSPAAAVDESQFLLGDRPAAAGRSGPSSFFLILRMVLVLVLVAVVIYLVVFFLRRLSKPQAAQNPHLKILASTHLGGGHYVHVISVGSKAWLVGSGEGGVRHIADISDQEEVDAMLLENSRKNAETPGLNPLSAFQTMLKRFSGGGETPPEDKVESMRKRRERFKRF